MNRLIHGLVVSAFAFATTSSVAQQVDRIVAFGDSYADTGNLLKVAGALFPAGLYPTGRFSGGTNFVDSLSAHYGVPAVDLAFGGAESGPTNILGLGLPGFQQQWQGFIGSGQTFGPHDLVAISVIGNDAIAYSQGGGTIAGASAAATVSASATAAGVDALATRGLRQLVFLAGDTGQIPMLAGTPSAPVASAFSAVYNAKLQGSLAPIAASGVTVAYIDLSAIGRVVSADPARFGFLQTTVPCPLACIGNPSLQQQYLFYVDGTHFTSAGMDLISRYIVNILGAPYTFRADGDLPEQAAQNFGQSLNGRLDLARGMMGKEGLSGYAFFDANGNSHNADADSNAYNYNATGVLAGVEYRRGQLILGSMFSYGRGDVQDPNGNRAQADSYQFGGYAGVTSGSLFAQAYAGYGWHRLDITRVGVADPLTASPDAQSWVAGGLAGYLFPMGPLRFGPVVGIDYASSHLSGYTETGDAVAAMIVSAQQVESLVAGAGGELRYKLTELVTPWIRVTAEQTLLGDGRDVSYAVVTAPGIVNGFTIADASRGVYGAVTGGISVEPTSGLSLEATVRAAFGRKEGNDLTGFAGLRLAF